MSLGKQLPGASWKRNICILKFKQSKNSDENEKIMETLHEDLQALLKASRIRRNAGNYLPNDKA